MVSQSKLKLLGLPEKEINVYIALLELEEASVQALARKTHIPRATIYLILDALEKKNLASQKKSGKRVLFVAEPPQRIMDLIKQKEVAIRTERDALESLLPELQALIRNDDKDVSVKYYPGVDGIRKMRMEILMQSKPTDVWHNFTPVDYISAVFKDDDAIYLPRPAKKVRAKIIFSTRSQKEKEYLLSRTTKDLAERKFISPDKFSSTSGLTIYGDSVAMATYTGKTGGIIIHSAAIAKMMREWFLITWNLL